MAPDVSFLNVTATDLSSVGREVADVVFTSNFLEHLRDKKECDKVLGGGTRSAEAWRKIHNNGA